MDPVERQRALEFAYRALDNRDRTEQELRLLLGQRKIDPDAIDAVVEELAELGLLDDARYAERFAEDRRLLDQWGRRRIASDLSRRGVRRELIDEALAGSGYADELEVAQDVLRRRYAAPFADDSERDKAWRLLVRRGYEPELAYVAVRRHDESLRRAA